MFPKRQQKAKGHHPTGEVFALGSKNESKSQSSSSSSQSRDGRKALGSASSSSTFQPKREPSSMTGSSLLKKPRLMTPLGRDVDQRASPTAQIYLYDSLAKEVNSPENLLSAVEEACMKEDDDLIEGLLCGAVKYLKVNRAKPDPTSYLTLLHLAKTQPAIFNTEVLIAAFCSLLKREAAISFKAKGNPLVSVLVCNVLATAFLGEENWPDSFMKIYLEDSLGDRMWVDRADCKVFVDNVQTAFKTKIPKLSMLASDSGLKFESTSGGSPVPMSIGDDEDSLPGIISKSSIIDEDLVSSLVQPRYDYQRVSIESTVLENLREHLNRRSDIGSKNVLRFMTVACGYVEVRSMAVQRLEMWLQSPKLTRVAQDLLMSVCLNCDQHSQQDIEIMNQISRIRMKTKNIINHYMLCIKELLKQHSENLRTLMTHTVLNELSNSRNPNNLNLIAAMFQYNPEQSAKLLAEVFQDLLSNRDDYLRALRALFREIFRVARSDINFADFCLGLMQERSETKYRDLDNTLKERMFLGITDLICLTVLLGVTSPVREAALALVRGDNKDVEILRTFQQQTAVIQRDAVWWLHTIVPTMFDPKPQDYCFCLRKVLFVGVTDSYYKLDNWPSENDRSLMLRLSSEVPVQEDTLMRVLVMGLTRELHLPPADSLDLADRLVKRAAMLYSEDFKVLQIQRLELVDALLNLCAYRHPENISLPKGYQPPNLAISSLYWKAWGLLLIISAFNPKTFGMAAWENYPTLKSFMEMAMTNTFQFPPPTMASDDNQLEDLKMREKQTAELEKQRILEFEVHLAAATSKKQITESNSILLAQLTTMNPDGIARKPPAAIMEHLSTMNQTLKIGQLLCSSRSPDFLLNIIQRQGASQSMPWLAELVEANDSSLDVLPVQCLCEFLLHDPTDEDDDDKRKKSKRSKQDQLLCRLQSLLHSSDSEPRAISEVLGYFLTRLSSQHSSTRSQAVKGLSMVLSRSHLEESMDSEYYESAEVMAIPSHKWLIDQLPSIPHFDSIKTHVCSSLREACQVETDAAAVSAYIIFLAEHMRAMPLQDLDELAFDMAQLIVERATLLNHMLPQEGVTELLSPWLQDRAELVLTAMIGLFNHYLSRAKQAQNENISWSNSQDQILVQWDSGTSATLNILVVQAMIILLTYGEPKKESAFKELLEVWFPSSGNMPSGFLVDTSEEALLLPDWLKLRMIRCHTDSLVDAALVDLDPSQLLLFVQSFGIPVNSMTKLLACLDGAMAADQATMSQAVVDKGYMAQLVEVQRMRGAKGGKAFHAMLVSAQEETTEKEMDTELRPAPRKRVLSQLSKSPELDLSKKDQIHHVLLKIFDASKEKVSAQEKQQLFSALNKAMVKDNTTQYVVSALHKLLTQSPSLVDGMKRSLHFSCPLLRVLISKESQAVFPVMKILSASLSGSRSALSALVTSFLESKAQKEITVAAKGDFKQSFLHDIKTQNPSTEKNLRSKLAALTAAGKSADSSLCQLLLDKNLPSIHHGLLLDWIQCIKCGDPDMHKLLFEKKWPEHSYLLSMLTHQSDWKLIHQGLELLLRGSDAATKSPSAVLDFLWALHHIPSIWQGVERKRSKNHIPPDVLRLKSSQVTVILSYIINEMKLTNDKVKFRQRVHLLHKCCCNRKDLIQTAVCHLDSRIKYDRDRSISIDLIMELYLEHRDVLDLVHDGSSVISQISVHQISQLDALTNRILNTLANSERGKIKESKMYDANLACRKFAVSHPVLLLRQLPLMSSMMQGRSNFTFNELRLNSHLLLFTHILGIMELLQPHIFQQIHHPALSEAFKAYFSLSERHGSIRMVAPIITKFIKFLHTFSLADSHGASALIRPYTHILNDLTSIFPDLGPLRGLLAILSLPTQENASESKGQVSMTPVRPSSPHMGSQLAPFRARLNVNSSSDILAVIRDLDETSKRKVDILHHFMSELQGLLLHLDEEVRNSAHSLLMRYLRHNPACASELKSSILQCLSSQNEDIVSSALRNLPEYVVLAHDDAVELLSKAFSVGVRAKVEAASYITESLQQLNLESMTW